MPVELLVDFLDAPLALAHADPVFMWKAMTVDQFVRGAAQTFFNLTVATSSSFSPESIVCKTHIRVIHPPNLNTATRRIFFDQSVGHDDMTIPVVVSCALR